MFILFVNVFHLLGNIKYASMLVSAHRGDLSSFTTTDNQPTI